MSIRESLRSYRDLVLYIQQLETDIETLYSKAENIRLRQNNLGVKIQTSMGSDPVGDAASQLADTAVSLREKIQKAEEERRVIDVALQELPVRDRRLIELRYINGLSWEKVSMEMQYSLPHIFRLHGKILQHFEYADSHFDHIDF